MPNPLADYVASPAPSFDYSDARTWYDGLWGGGLWPPEGFPGHPQIHGLSGWGPIWNQPAAWMPGDRALLRAASLRGLGDVCTADQISAINQGLIPSDSCTAPPSTPANPASPPCLFACGSGAQLAPGQVFCGTGTTTPPACGTGSQQQQQQGTVMLILGGAALLLLFVFAKV